MEKNLNFESTLDKPSGIYFRIKRLLDISISIVLLVVLAPVMLVIYLLLLIVDGTPVFFRQIRIGKDETPFVIWKFRTMPVQKPAVHKRKLTERKGWGNGVPVEFVFKSAVPSGVKKLGMLLRKYSVDELPQLFNVLRGDMSLVGPRPEIPDITLFYNREQRERLTVKPGITGFAQINGRSNMNHGKKIEYDLYYVNHCSLRLDFIIMFASVIKVIKAKDSY